MTLTPQLAARKQDLSLKRIFDFLWNFRRRISRRILLFEFMPDALLLSEGSLQASQVALNHCRVIELPEGATDRGTPLDSVAMAGLISDACVEENLPSLRTAVVLPPEAVHVSSHWLPAGLGTNELRSFVLQPDSPVQLPFPLDQTDFELVPHHIAALEGTKDLQYYCLLAVPKRLTDRLIETMKLTGQELLYVGSSVMGLLRLARFALMDLSDQEVILLLELLGDYTHVTVASATAPICCDRLTAIREFPAFPKLIATDDKPVVGSVAKPGLPDDYLPLSELDLRALAADIKAFISEFQSKNIVSLKVVKVLLSGPSSAHPGLDELLVEALEIPVQRLRVRNDPQVASAQLPDGLYAAAISRLVGLVLNFLPAPVCSEDWNVLMQPKPNAKPQPMPTIPNEPIFISINEPLVEQAVIPELQIKPKVEIEIEIEKEVKKETQNDFEPMFTFGAEEVGNPEISKPTEAKPEILDLENEVEETFSLGLGDPEMDDPSQWPSIKG